MLRAGTPKCDGLPIRALPRGTWEIFGVRASGEPDVYFSYVRGGLEMMHAIFNMELTGLAMYASSGTHESKGPADRATGDSKATVLR